VDNPNEDSIYLCGNSLGLQAKKSREYIDRELNKWATVYV
jgi:kynureninase